MEIEQLRGELGAEIERIKSDLLKWIVPLMRAQVGGDRRLGQAPLNTENPMMRRPMASGFTLIELMIVVAIVGILALIAYPSYQEHVRKSRRSDATISLLNAAQALERCYTATNAYDDASCSVPASSQEGHYAIAATVQTAAAYTLTATPAAGDPQASDAKCTSFVLTHTGVRTATGTLGNDCWP